ncbi:hypothetical protein QCD79_31065, partial [Pseudomonas quasicaspiana]|nr:hypothetical protein [Pseudomonas quasicaspiana]
FIVPRHDEYFGPTGQQLADLICNAILWEQGLPAMHEKQADDIPRYRLSSECRPDQAQLLSNITPIMDLKRGPCRS